MSNNMSMKPRQILKNVALSSIHDDIITARLNLHVRVNGNISDDIEKDACYKMWQVLYEDIYDRLCNYTYTKDSTLADILEDLKPPV